MSVRSWSTVLALSVVAALSLFRSPEAAAAGDAGRGKTLSYTCLGCHGIPSYKNAYPTYSVPKLQGQHPEYIIAALKGYQTQERGHATMHAQAWSLSTQDMEDIAIYIAGEPVKVSAGVEPVGQPPAAVATCAACHGTQGVGIMGMYPTLSGQHADYLEYSLNSYRKGTRKNGIMAPFASQLKPEEVRQVAEYFAKQKPALATVPLKGYPTAAAR